MTELTGSERSRRQAGGFLYGLGMLGGGLLLVLVFLLPPLLTKNPAQHYANYILAAFFAFPAALVYMLIPRLLDRYDPEPGWVLAMVFSWGAIASCGFSALINTFVGSFVTAAAGKAAGSIAGACISAPLVEEFWKGLAIAGVFLFVRREFDGVLDGIIYATFVALGFAALENVIYYAQAAQNGQIVELFVLRGIISPWGHPLFTAMTGIGFGVARETTSPTMRKIAPLLGYMAAVFLHFVWNTAATLSGFLVLLMLPLWGLVLLGFLGVILWLMKRRGRIMRKFLTDEVAIGNLSPPELDLVCSPFGRLKARMTYGKHGEEFVRSAARLALCKWHTLRAMQEKKGTMSADFIVPLRRRLSEIRMQVFGPAAVPHYQEATYPKAGPQGNYGPPGPGNYPNPWRR